MTHTSENLQIFLDRIFWGLEKLKIDVSNHYLDHICYRVATEAEYGQRKAELLKDSQLLIESPVNGRLISTFKLNHPVIYGQRKIEVIELPSPKKNTEYTTGFEHVEFVINESFSDFTKKYPHINFDHSSASKNFNPEIRIELEKNISVKFHQMSLEKVIEIEKKQISI